MKIVDKSLFGCMFSLVSFAAYAGNDRPNIMLVYIDDLGYCDPSCYGELYGDHFVETPNIDRLAASGVMFTSAYSAAPISTAARVGLLTGQFPARSGIEFVTSHERKAVAWHSDKWRKKFEDKKLLPPPLTLNLPLESVTIAEDLKDAGYKTAIAGKWHVAAHNKVYNGWSEQYGPAQRGFQWTANTFGAFAGESETVDSPAYPEDELTEKSINFLKQNHKKPFFLYVSHYFVHTPFRVKSEESLEKFRTLHPEWDDQQVQYAVYVDRVDHYIGQLLDTLEETGLDENTIVILSSDNGGHPNFSSNKPLRGSKWNLYEGGVRIPMIISYPKMFPQNVSEEFVSQLDLYPTIMELAEAKASRPLDGSSLMGLLTGEDDKVDKKKTMIWHFPYYHPEGDAYHTAIDEIGVDDRKVSKTKPQSAIRKGKYKLIYFYEDESYELYDLSKDLSEQNDLSDKKPALAKSLRNELMEILHSANARFPERKN